MTNEEAKFILRAYRAGGQDASDPHFAAALDQARRDPALRDWFAREQALDAATGERLRTVAPPVGLRAAILTGARLGQRSHVWWRRPAWLAAAAALAMLLALGGLLRPTTASAELSVDAYIQAAVADLGGAHAVADHHMGAVSAWLANPAQALLPGLPRSPAELHADRCRSFRVAGVEVFEVCFKRDVWYHLYVVRRSDVEATDLNDPLFREQGRTATATWQCPRYVYVLAAHAGLDAVRQLL